MATYHTSNLQNRTSIFAAFLLLFALHAPTRARDFDPRRDGFAFSNETRFDYTPTASGAMAESLKKNPPAFRQRCLCLVRGALQFYHFARFDPKAPRVTEAEYRRRVRELFRISAWRRPWAAADRIVFPGYADLWSFSAANRQLIQDEIGGWVATYLRFGNWRMAWQSTRLLQGSTARAVERDLPYGPQALYLAKFPSMNHGVLVFHSERLADGRIRFRVYDPNYAGQSARLDYLPSRNLFEFEPRFYWPGGVLRAFRIYLSPFQ